MSDKERLDWLESRGGVPLEKVTKLYFAKKAEIYWRAGRCKGDTLREAIDNAMKQESTNAKR